MMKLIHMSPILTTEENGLGSMLNNLCIRMAYNTEQTLKDLLGNPIDKTGSFEKSGLYEINCDDLNIGYYAQGRTAVRTYKFEDLVHIYSLQMKDQE